MPEPSPSRRYAHVLYEVADGLATITLNRPDKLNAYLPLMGDELVDAFQRARDDGAVRAVVWTGAGRSFCAGVDLEALAAHRSNGESAERKLGEEDFLRKLPLELADFPKPVVAALNGHAIGVGLTMVLPCDVRIAASGAKLGLTFAKLGILPGLGSTHLLPRLVGLGRALELVLSARVMLAEEAATIGLVNRCVPGADLLPTARVVAAEMGAHDSRVLVFARRALRRGAEIGMAEAMQSEQALSAELRKLRAKEDAR
jgi:enoyl-CoA hydratase/carnithine racemase